MAIDYTKRKPAAEPPVSLTKVSLTKSAPTVSLTKQGAASGVVRVNLNWDARPSESGVTFLKRRQPGIDLDLACLYSYTDSSQGVVQALGERFRDSHTFGADPICWLDGDDRSGDNTGGENLYVDLRHVAAIKRILVFAFIYEGVPNWAAANAVVTLTPAAGPEIEVRLDEPDDSSTTCAIAMLENVAGDLTVRREIRYIRGNQRQLDEAYGWGMRWTAGSK